MSVLIASLICCSPARALPDPLHLVWRHQIHIDQFEPDLYERVIAFRNGSKPGVQGFEIKSGKVISGPNLAKTNRASRRRGMPDLVTIGGVKMRIIWSSDLSELAVGTDNRLYRLNPSRHVHSSARLPAEYTHGSKTLTEVAPYLAVEGDADVGPFFTYLESGVENDEHTSCYKVFIQTLIASPHTFRYVTDIGPLGALGYLENPSKSRSQEIYAAANDGSTPVSYVEGKSGKILWSHRFQFGISWMGSNILACEARRCLLLNPKTRTPVGEIRELEARPLPSEIKFGDYYVLATRHPRSENLYDYACYRLAKRFALQTP